tara:strand:+ start:352 stop:780 length:429 start_codon:yes stop_codon:yes gene_type:complete
MALVRLKTHRVEGALEIRGVGETVYSLTAQIPCEVPARIAALYLGDDAILVDFTVDDKKDIANLPENRLKAIRRHLGVEGDIIDVLFPKKVKTPVKKQVETIVETIVETVTPKEEAVVEETKIKEVKVVPKKTTKKTTKAVK